MRGIVPDQLKGRRFGARDEVDLRIGLDGIGESVSTPLSCMATVRFASDGEMDLAISYPDVPWATLRCAPSETSR